MGNIEAPNLQIEKEPTKNFESIREKISETLDLVDFRKVTAQILRVGLILLFLSAQGSFISQEANFLGSEASAASFEQGPLKVEKYQLGDFEISMEYERSLEGKIKISDSQGTSFPAFYFTINRGGIERLWEAQESNLDLSEIRMPLIIFIERKNMSPKKRRQTEEIIKALRSIGNTEVSTTEEIQKELLQKLTELRKKIKESKAETEK